MTQFSWITLFGLALLLFAARPRLTEAAKILAIFPFAGPSQYIFVQPYLKALAGRGHDLTVISGFPQKQPVERYHDLPILEIHAKYEEFILSLLGEGEMGKWEQMTLFQQFFQNVSTTVLDNAGVRRHLFAPNTRFDLVIVETLHTELLYAFGHHFGAPLIGVSTYGTDPIIDELVDNVSPMSYSPLVTSDLKDRMNFWERLKNVWLIANERVHRRLVHAPKQEKLMKKYFPQATADLEEIRHNFSLILLNQHFSLSFARPYVPNMIEVGGMHLNYQPARLPADMERFLNESREGVVYFSLGSNIKSKDLPRDRLDMLMRAFAALPQRVMWKFEEPNLPGKPDNVFIAKWFPQPDLLAHPKVKLFITHCGLLSTIEAIFHGKPVVGVPMFFDQFLNMARVEEAGFGIGIKMDTVTAEELSATIAEVLSNAKYGAMARKMSARYHDQPLTPLETAIFWTEYILRHEGAPHMRVSGRYLNFLQVNSLDTIGFMVVCLLLALLVPIAGVWFIRIAWGLLQGGLVQKKKQH